MAGFAFAGCNVSWLQYCLQVTGDGLLQLQRFLPWNACPWLDGSVIHFPPGFARQLVGPRPGQSETITHADVPEVFLAYCENSK